MVDPAAELSAFMSTGIGVTNVRQRLALLYQGRANFQLSQQGSLVVAQVRFPLQTIDTTNNVVEKSHG